MSREIANLKSFMTALDSEGKDPLEIGMIPPNPVMANSYFNASVGEGEFGGGEHRGTVA